MDREELEPLETATLRADVARWAQSAERGTDHDFAEIVNGIHALADERLADFGAARIRLLDRHLDLGTSAQEHLLSAVSAGLGFVVPQSHKNNLVAHIRDEGGDYRHHGTRGHQTNAALAFHSDRCDMNMLLYVHVAAAGGEISVVSYDDAAARTRELDAKALTWMFDGFPFDLREERIYPSLRWHWRPVLWRNARGIRGHYIRRFIHDAQRHADAPTLTDEQNEALDRFDEALESLRPEHTFSPEPGDLLILSNYRVMHARSGYSDAGAGASRLALRTWVAPFDSEELPAYLHPLSGSCRAGSFRGGVGCGEEYLSRLGRGRVRGDGKRG